MTKPKGLSMLKMCDCTQFKLITNIHIPKYLNVTCSVFARCCLYVYVFKVGHLILLDNHLVCYSPEMIISPTLRIPVGFI